MAEGRGRKGDVESERRRALAETRSEKTGGRLRCRGARGSRMGKRVQAAVRGWRQGYGPNSPRSSMAGRRLTARGEQGGGRVRLGRGVRGWGTSGSWRPGHDHVRKLGPAGMGLGEGDGNELENSNLEWGL